MIQINPALYKILKEEGNGPIFQMIKINIFKCCKNKNQNNHDIIKAMYKQFNSIIHWIWQKQKIPIEHKI